jgi:hypothetical protein
LTVLNSGDASATRKKAGPKTRLLVRHVTSY